MAKQREGLSDAEREQAFAVIIHQARDGPGYVVYIPKSDPTGLEIFFPLQHRTLTTAT